MFAGAPLGGEALQNCHRLLGVDRAIDLDRQGLAGELVDDVQELQLAAVICGVVLEVEGPDVVGELGPEALGGHRGLAQAPALLGLDGHAQPLLAPDPLHSLAVQ